MATLSSILHSMRASYPPNPVFTEKDLPDLSGKVYIITGATSGVGEQLTSILYSQHATIYLGVRSSTKAQTAIQKIQTAHPSSTGTLHHLPLDLSDLTTISSSVQSFLNTEARLDVLFNNAGVMVPPQGSVTKQGYELQLGTNCVAPFLLTKLLTPVLERTAAGEKEKERGGVRVVWVSSSAAEVGSPAGGVDLGNLDYRVDVGRQTKYAVSKAGNWYHAVEFARRYRESGVVSVALNPGNLKTELQRHVPGWLNMAFNLILYDAKFGAYTELFAGLSPDVTLEKTGSWIQPWGRFVPIRADLEVGAKPESEGGTGIAQKFWEWSEEQVREYC
ncbi:short-chain dehydrogenase protein [Rutstroemia sp. NJR-2017a WRK4]|nr:short-chain dehydrogenase protein [Rutstroemia sp. NJR-2017a WRK4]